MATRKEKCSTFKINVSVISSDMDAKAETVNTRYVRDDPRVDDKAPSNRGQTNVLCRTCAAVLFITSGGFCQSQKKKRKKKYCCDQLLVSWTALCCPPQCTYTRCEKRTVGRTVKSLDDVSTGWEG